jgi:hypothetical protein
LEKSPKDLVGEAASRCVREPARSSLVRSEVRIVDIQGMKKMGSAFILVRNTLGTERFW